MSAVTLESLTERLALADQLLEGRGRMLNPQDLPGRYGRVVHAIDHVLQAMSCESVLAGGWAVWRHGFTGRVTQDVDIVLPADRLEEFMRVASVSGFESIPVPQGRWPKLQHKQTNIKVDLLPEGARPGTESRPAPTTIPHPSQMGAPLTPSPSGGEGKGEGGGQSWKLHYIRLPYLIELKLAAGRVRDEADVVELIRANPHEVPAVRAHLSTVHRDYMKSFDHLVERARDQQDA
jgi:hypothetical protein